MVTIVKIVLFGFGLILLANSQFTSHVSGYTVQRPPFQIQDFQQLSFQQGLAQKIKPQPQNQNSQQKISDVNSISGLSLIYRNHDGTDNNQNNRLWGSKGSVLERRGFANYEDGKSRPISNLPNPRKISNEVGDVNRGIVKSFDKITTAFVIWGQFLDHDVDLTKQGDSENFSISIPSIDIFFSGQSYLNFKRSEFIAGSSPRAHKNTITSWIDGSQVYGSDQSLANSLRSFQNGKMKVSSGNLLPKDSQSLFQAGDERVNENIFLTTYHTIFVREHNRLCDRIRNQDSDLNDEQIYQSARNYVMGLLQKITMDDFLPTLLGNEFQNIIGSYNGYKDNINPNIPTQFSTAAYRIGHALLVDVYPLISKSGLFVGQFHLRDLFFRPDLFSNFNALQNALRGLTKNLMKEKSIKVADSVRNLLVESPDDRQIKLDLYALNIQRGRDHGLPLYNDMRQAFGLPKYFSFAQLVNDAEISQKLGQLYGSVENLDLVVGIFAEKSVRGGVLGELGAKIVGQTFRNLRDGDRFWYQSAYPSSIISQIKATTFADVIVRNTNIDKRQIKNDVFHL